jgi:hypothetical protein
MKKQRLAAMNIMCSLCLAMVYYVKFSGISFLFFGEPNYPNESDF